MSSLACFQQIPSQITTIGINLVELPIISPKNPIPTNFMWEEVHPYLKFEVPQCRGVFHDSENGFSLQFGVEMRRDFGASKDNNGGGERKKKSYVEGEEKLLNFSWRKRENLAFIKKMIFSFLFLKAMPHVSFWVEQKGPPFYLDVTSYSATRREKFDLLNGKNPALVCVSLLWFQFLAFLYSRWGPFLKVGNIYIKTLRMRPWAWFRGWFC